MDLVLAKRVAYHVTSALTCIYTMVQMICPLPTVWKFCLKYAHINHGPKNFYRYYTVAFTVPSNSKHPFNAQTSSVSTRCTGISAGGKGKVWPQNTSMRPPSAESSISDSTSWRRTFHAKQEKTQAEVEQQDAHVTGCKDVRELKNNCKAAAQVGRRGYAAASLDLQQVRANFVIARVGSFLSKMLTEQTILALICMTRKIGFRSDILHEYCRFTVNGIFTPTVN